MTEFEEFVAEELGKWADGEGDMAHDVLGRIVRGFEQTFGYTPELPEGW